MGNIEYYEDGTVDLNIDYDQDDSFKDHVERIALGLKGLRDILITGADNPYAFYLTDILLWMKDKYNLSYNVILSDKSKSSDWARNRNVGYEIADLGIEQESLKLVGNVKPDLVFHLSHFYEKEEINIFRLENIVNSCQEYKVPKIMVLSHNKCYAPSDAFISENSAKDHSFRFEKIIYDLYDGYTEIYTIRPSYVTGAMSYGEIDALMYMIEKRMLLGIPDTPNMFSVVHIKDVAFGMAMLAACDIKTEIEETEEGSFEDRISFNISQNPIDIESIINQINYESIDDSKKLIKLPNFIYKYTGFFNKVYQNIHNWMSFNDGNINRALDVVDKFSKSKPIISDKLYRITGWRPSNRNEFKETIEYYRHCKWDEFLGSHDSKRSKFGNLKMITAVRELSQKLTNYENEDPYSLVKIPGTKLKMDLKTLHIIMSKLKHNSAISFTKDNIVKLASEYGFDVVLK